VQAPQNASTWSCSSLETTNLPEDTHCILTCHQGFIPVNGLVQCKSDGIMLTKWTHIAYNLTQSAYCQATPNNCQNLKFSSFVGSAGVIDETMRSKIVTNSIKVSSLSPTTQDFSFTDQGYLSIQHGITQLPLTISFEIKLQQTISQSIRTILTFGPPTGPTLPLLYITGDRNFVLAGGSPVPIDFLDGTWNTITIMLQQTDAQTISWSMYVGSTMITTSLTSFVQSGKTISLPNGLVEPPPLNGPQNEQIVANFWNTPWTQSYGEVIDTSSTTSYPSPTPSSSPTPSPSYNIGLYYFSDTLTIGNSLNGAFPLIGNFRNFRIWNSTSLQMSVYDSPFVEICG